jgi:peptidyl-prolyl cis-trans isomerase D
MSILQKIREKTYLALIFVGLGIALFVIDPSSIFSGSQRGETHVGVIAGEKIEGQDFELKVQEAIENYKANYQQANIDEATKEAIRNQTWEQQIQEIVMGAQHEELGLSVSAEELFDMIQGPNPSQQVRQAFGNPQTGEFNPGNVIAFLKRMDEDETGETKKRWLAFERDLKKQQVYTKYNTLVKKGLYITTAEAKADNVAKNKMASIRFVAKRYAASTDTTVAVTDAEIKAYYAANNYKEQYKQDEAVDLKYVAFDIKPSDDDNQAAKKWIDKTTEEFKLTNNDTLFININSDKPYAAAWYAESALPAAVDTLKKAAVGTIADPYLEGESWKVAKLLGTKMAVDSVKARHILLKVEGGNAELVKAKADSLKKVIKSKNNFAELAKALSTDAGSGANGGDLGWFKEGVMVPSFNDACFNGKKGDMPIVESQFGIHLIEILDRSKESRKLNIGTIERLTEPSDKTFQNIYSKASDFSTKNRTLEAFEAAATEAGYNVRIASNIKPMESKVAGLDNPRPLIQWAYNTAKKGDVSDVYEVGSKYVVAVLAEKYEKGVKPLETIKEELEAEVRKQKKAEQFVKEFEAVLAAKPSIEDLGGKMNAPVETAQNVVFSAGSIPGMGKEPEVLGTIAALKAAQVSKPVIGLSGVYVVYVDNVVEAPEVTDFTALKKQLEQTLASRADYEVYEALKDKAEVKDNRVKFY